MNNAGGLVPAPAAGAEPGSGPLAALRDQWHQALDKNLLSAVLTTTAVRDQLASPGGAVISIGTLGAERRGGSYGAAKAALAAWSAALSATLGPRGVTVNVVAAGFVEDTAFFGPDSVSDERCQSLVAETHNKRAGTPDGIVETIRFLASPGARHITGQTVHVNGGAFTTR